MENIKLELSKYGVLYLINLCRADQEAADKAGFPVSAEARRTYDTLVENS